MLVCGARGPHGPTVDVVLVLLHCSGAVGQLVPMRARHMFDRPIGATRPLNGKKKIPNTSACSLASATTNMR